MIDDGVVEFRERYMMQKMLLFLLFIVIFGCDNSVNNSDTSGIDTSGIDTSGIDTSGIDTSGTDTSGTEEPSIKEEIIGDWYVVASKESLDAELIEYSFEESNGIMRITQNELTEYGYFEDVGFDIGIPTDTTLYNTWEYSWKNDTTLSYHPGISESDSVEAVVKLFGDTLYLSYRYDQYTGEAWYLPLETTIPPEHWPQDMQEYELVF